jgi:hypothetical protein
MEDGYVTGLEPATNYPNHRAFERQHGRVITIPPGERYAMHIALEVQDTALGVQRLLAEVAALQGDHPPTIHRGPSPEWCG